MAASAALRGVRTGPNFFSGGSSAFAASGFDASPQQGPGTLGLLYGMGSGVNGGISQFAGGSSAVQPAVNVNGLGFGADLSGALAGRPLLDIGFPYQSYGAYGGGALGSSQAAVLMAQTAALRGTQSTAYLGFPGKFFFSMSIHFEVQGSLTLVLNKNRVSTTLGPACNPGWKADYGHRSFPSSCFTSRHWIEQLDWE